jgi:hypothetical protein
MNHSGLVRLLCLGLAIGLALSPPPRAEAQTAAPPAGGVSPASAVADSAAPPAPLPWAAPAGVSAADTPSDDGSSITVTWSAVTGAARYRIERAEPEGEFAEVGSAVATLARYHDETVEPDHPFVYRVVALGPAGEEGVSTPTAPVSSRAQWFNDWLTLVLIALIAFIIVILYFIRRARSGEHLFIRRISGLEAVDEAVGRATEMGRAVLYVPGVGDISYLSSIASLNVLGEIAKKTAEYGTALRVPCANPVVYTVAREVVQGAYAAAGRPDAYDADSVFFLTEYALSYAASVQGIMVRERPATNFLLGYFAGESLILAETGAATGAIQIAGTDATAQLPFFVVACDYTLIGEELYAASAYISREPLSVGALKGQDVGKVVLLLTLIVGTILSLLGVNFVRLLETAPK